VHDVHVANMAGLGWSAILGLITGTNRLVVALQDGEALKLHRAFVAAMQAAEAAINQRNSAGTASVARSLAKAGLPYNYLMPSSPAQTQEQRDNLEPNITGRGIPYSISI